MTLSISEAVFNVTIGTHRDLVVDRDLRLSSTSKTAVISDIREDLQIGINAGGIVQVEWDREVGLLVAAEFQVIHVTRSNQSVVDWIENLTV
jgi:hypothetical protein